jgi:hypothetical protein
VETLGPAKTQGSKLSSEWCEGRVREYGETKEKKQQSIRRNFLVMNYGQLMLMLVTFYALLEKKQLNVWMLKHKKKYYTTCRIFRTAYEIAKLNRPMTDLAALIDLQELNGLANHACTDICDHIADEMRKKLVKYILDNDLKIGFMIDDSSTRSKKEALVICLLCKLPDSMDASSLFIYIYTGIRKYHSRNYQGRLPQQTPA